ncbi:D-stereospecific peptide hydrolase precursor [Streptomyces sp. NBRC 110611]|uniref:serine hydrolase domain-containing protein n=1 Tax=Streptomyces sp. NBRC 110611 TaxID=1621259 RepID=UPI000858C4E6|nr:serine hydrolase domain-containing protein [Streptomyces sp. NBRC 110611]GAU70298.1 D-stereospecific peptide hydrolase precursor [Streptomyces sp. NBRC 110611]
MKSTLDGRRLTALCGTAMATVVALAGTAPAQAASAGDHAATQKALNSFQAQTGPGAAVYAGDRTGSWHLGAGTGTVNTHQPIQPTQHFRAGSQTKTFTAAVVLQLAEEQKVSLDAPIGRYLPGVVDGNGYDGNKITVRQLLQHTSGIPTNRRPQAKPGPDGSYTLAEVVRDGLRLAPASAPGAAWHYSNTNFEILGMLIERITGMPVGEALTRRIIEPLGLKQTTFPKPGDRSLPAPYVHGYKGGRLGPVFLWVDASSDLEPSVFSSAGAMISTLQDLTAFDQALLSGKIVSPESLALMRTTVPVGERDGYGLGLSSHTLPCGGTAWGHSGSVPGYVSMTLVTPDGRHASVLTNTQMESPKLVDVLDSALCE